MFRLKKWLSAGFCGALAISYLNGQTVFATKADNNTNTTSFAIKLFDHEQRNENAVVSPFSAYYALSMAANGAHGTTRQQIGDTLGFDASHIDSVNRHNLRMITTMQSQPDNVQLEIANAIISDRNYAFKNSFKSTCHEFYKAEAQSLDFNSSVAINIINGWCKEKTHGKIEKIVASLDSSEKLVLLNTVYFKGEWASAFKKAVTKPEPFLVGLKKPTNQSIDMMHGLKTLPYLRETNFQAISMPYKGLKQSLYVFLPDSSSTLKTMIASFTETNWKSWMNSFQEKKIELSLPRVKVAYSAELSGTLGKIGMPLAFSSGADFSEMTDPPQRLQISRVLQKTYLEIDEEGTEAAAATAAVVASYGGYGQAPNLVYFRVNRPFVVALVDNQSKEILFLGAISNPQK